MQPYEDYLKKCNQAIKHLKSIAPTVESVNDLESEREELAFVQAFRNLIRLKNILSGFSDFTFDDLYITEQEFEDYKSKYLDIYDKTKAESEGEKTSIIDDIDFELELIQRDQINVAYILQLLANLKVAESKGKTNSKDIASQRKAILDLLGNDVKLRSKRELIEKFIHENLPTISKKADVKEAFVEYWNDEKRRALTKLSEEENLIDDKLVSMIDDYLFTGHTPLRETVYESIEKDKQPKILERKTVTERIINKIKAFIKTFEDDMGDI